MSPDLVLLCSNIWGIVQCEAFVRCRCIALPVPRKRWPASLSKISREILLKTLAFESIAEIKDILSILVQEHIDPIHSPPRHL